MFNKSAKNNAPKTAFTETIEWIESIVFSIFAIILVFVFVMRIVGVVGESMENTFLNGDRLIIRNIGYTPERGDVVVVSRSYLPKDHPDSTEPIIKRVIAVGGQTVETKADTSEVYVDGVLLQEDYIKESNLLYVYQDKVWKIPEGHIFVMGDNRRVSKDSRNSDIGVIDERYVLGEVVFRIYPFDNFEAVKGWDYE